jgi:hypothetical protein
LYFVLDTTVSCDAIGRHEERARPFVPMPPMSLGHELGDALGITALGARHPFERRAEVLSMNRAMSPETSCAFRRKAENATKRDEAEARVSAL